MASAPYGKPESLMRRILHYGIGDRPLHGTRSLGSVLTHLYNLYSVKVIIWTEGRWKVAKDDAV